MSRKKPRDLMATLMAGGVPERIPYFGDMPRAFWQRLERELGRPPAEVYHLDWGERGVGARELGKAPWDLPWDNPPDDEREEQLLRERFARYLPEDRPPGLRVSEHGAITVPGSMYHLRRMIHPLAGATHVSEIDEFPLPDITESWRWEEARRKSSQYLAQGCWVVGGVGSIFEDSWFIRGQEQLLIDMYENPELLTRLLDRITEDRLYRAVRLAEMGVDCLGCGDDMGHQRQLFMRPEDIRKWILSRWERVIGAAKAVKADIKVDFHTDGRCEEMVADLMAIGMTAINPVQPECDDPEHLKRTFGRELVLKGTLSSQVLTFGTPEQIAAEIEVRMDTAKRWGGMLITPNNCPDVNTPYENLKAFYDACERYGTIA